MAYLWAGLPAKASVSPVSAEDWMTRVATWRSGFLELLTAHAPAGWCGRTSPVSCQAGEDGTLEPSSGRWANSGMGGPTESWTLSTSEWNHTPGPSPSDDVVCSLSDVLETGDVPRRYYLSGKSCRGILRRAGKRGKDLPQALRLALEAAAD